MSNLDIHREYVAGADKNDRRRFDDLLLGWLLNAADAETVRAACEHAASVVNGGGS